MIKKIGLLCTNKRNINFEQLLVERDGHSISSDSEDSDDALLNFLDVERELPDVTVTHRHSTTINKDNLCALHVILAFLICRELYGQVYLTPLNFAL